MPPVTFQEYFEGCFSADLASFLEAIPASQRKHYAKAPESYSVAMNYLVDPRTALRKIPLERRPLFAASLYFASLMDQAMHYHHFESYERYRLLTDYPKLTGACPGACMYMAEPSMALERTNLFDANPSEYIQQDPRRLAQNKSLLDPLVKDGTAYFRQAFPTFLRSHFPEISEPESFYRRVFNEMPHFDADGR